jgi:hypothetical protein
MNSEATLGETALFSINKVAHRVVNTEWLKEADGVGQSSRDKIIMYYV